MHTSDASELVGKTRFVLCPVFGRVGVACLQPLDDLAQTVILSASPEVLQCLVFLREAVRLVKPVTFPLLRAVKQHVVLIWTDASTIPKLGIVVYIPDSRRWYYASSIVPPWMMALFYRLQRKQTYICQLELLAVVCAYLTFGDLLRGRLIHHFIDNDPALKGLIKGSSSKPDSCRLIHEYTLATVAWPRYRFFHF